MPSLSSHSEPSRSASAEPAKTERELALILMTSSSTMVGVCGTLIGLVKIMEGRTGPSNVDKYVACDMAAFMVVVMISYVALRLKRASKPSRVLEWIADGLFIVALAVLTGIGILFGYEMI